MASILTCTVALPGLAAAPAGTRCTGITVDLSEISGLLNARATIQKMGRSYLLLKHNRVTQVDCAYGGGTLTADTSIAVSSSTKAMTGMLAKTLEQEGYLDLDAAPYAFDPDPAWLEGDWPQVTLRQLLTHTSGTWLSGPEDLPEWRYCDVDLSEAVRRIRDHGFEPAQTPGGQFHYSANALQIAAHLISQAMSTNFVDLMDWYLFERLGLTDASMWCRRNPSAGGGVKASPAEYVAFLDAYLPRSASAIDVFGQGGFRAVRDMISDQVGAVPIVGSPYFELIGDEATEIGYGLGIWIEATDLKGQPVRLAAPGSRGTVPWVDRSCGVAAILVAEDSGVSIERIFPVYQRILDILNRRLGCHPPNIPPPPRQ